MLFPWFDKERFFSLSVVALAAIACSAVTVRPTATKLLDDKNVIVLAPCTSSNEEFPRNSDGR